MANLTASVKMYRMGELGDCFLLHFKEGNEESRVLIDCGSFRNSKTSKQRVQAVVDDIKASLKGKKLDVVVGTHQHNDHLSGFTHCEPSFQGIVDQVWLSWLDDPKDGFARKVQEDQFGLLKNLKDIQLRLSSLGIAKEHEEVSDVLNFFGVSGDEPAIPSLGVKALKKMGDKEPEYLSPGEIKELPGMKRSSVKVYVLGPPRNRQAIFDKDPSKEETYDPHFALAEASAGKILAALDNRMTNGENRDEAQFPFNSIFKKKPKEIDTEIQLLYNHKKDSYRKIDNDWIKSADRLALYLDSFTNNSSLVLAFELVKTGKVLLFAADAQTGNWVSWEKIKWNPNEVSKDFNTYQLIRNTVLYKVGHHGSHNATLVNALEAMKHEELVAMIPVDKTDPNITKKKGWKMPAKNLYKRLKEKTKHRIILMDDGFADGCDPKKHKKSKWSDLPHVPKMDKKKLFFEYVVQG